MADAGIRVVRQGCVIDSSFAQVARAEQKASNSSWLGSPMPHPVPCLFLGIDIRRAGPRKVESKV